MIACVLFSRGRHCGDIILARRRRLRDNDHILVELVGGLLKMSPSPSSLDLLVLLALEVQEGPAEVVSRDIPACPLCVGNSVARQLGSDDDPDGLHSGRLLAIGAGNLRNPDELALRGAVEPQGSLGREPEHHLDERAAMHPNSCAEERFQSGSHPARAGAGNKSWGLATSARA